MERKFVLVKREDSTLVSYTVFSSFEDARVERHALEIHNAGLVVDIKELVSICRKGD